MDQGFIQKPMVPGLLGHSIPYNFKYVHKVKDWHKGEALGHPRTEDLHPVAMFTVRANLSVYLGSQSLSSKSYHCFPSPVHHSGNVFWTCLVFISPSLVSPQSPSHLRYTSWFFLTVIMTSLLNLL